MPPAETTGDRTTWRPVHNWKSTGYADNRGSHYKCSRCGAMAYRGGVLGNEIPGKFTCRSSNIR